MNKTLIRLTILTGALGIIGCLALSARLQTWGSHWDPHWKLPMWTPAIVACGWEWEVSSTAAGRVVSDMLDAFEGKDRFYFTDPTIESIHRRAEGIRKLRVMAVTIEDGCLRATYFEWADYYEEQLRMGVRVLDYSNRTRIHRGESK